MSAADTNHIDQSTAVSKVVATIETLKSKGVVQVEKIHTGLNSSVELVVTVSKGPLHTEYLKSMEERKGKPHSPSSSNEDDD
ncbi:hypothetical protein DFA_08306 [Cavenderia fasciculata]|uniref:Uncharacterized protein n=1 Tax=Cavenderia fasciculata TaxID=261658 RepID=F4Q5Q4_CACFS|nr:uncharacterized protein DFA_08306 [Cavenderia fasciculata]EGG17313.1 hypothetical protein DFA_08306 [Cavenderia fasciculata]|eukprot:XP_004355797.1 hypothetical protein DFA_08306 [Cavenderia fasciculata]